MSEARRIADSIAEHWPDKAIVVTPRNSNAYLGAFSWAAKVNPSNFAMDLRRQVVAVLESHNDGSWDVGPPMLFVKAATQVERYTAILVFVRVPGETEHVVVIRAEP